MNSWETARALCLFFIAVVLMSLILLTCHGLLHICSAFKNTPPAGHREKSQLPTVLLLGSAKNEYARCMRANTRRFCSLLSHGQTNSCRSV